MAFRANAMRMVAGTLFAQAAPLLAAPLLARLYTPEAFGLQYLFMSLASAFAVLATCRLDLAMVLAERDEDADALAGFIVGLTLAAAALMLLAVGAAGPHLAATAGYAGSTAWLWMLPLGVAAISVFQVSAAFATRRQAFGRIAAANGGNQGLFIVFAVTGATFRSFTQGLVLSKLLGQLLSAAAFAWSESRNWRRVNPIRSMLRARELCSRNAPFLLYNTPYSLSGSFMRDAPLFLIPALSSAIMSGHFALARTVMMAPALLASGALSPVFFREAVSHRGTPYLRQLAVQLLRDGALATAPVFASLLVWGDVLFVFAFGPAWETAGKFAMMLSPAAWWAVQTAWPERLFEVHARQGTALALQLSTDVLTALLFLATLLWSDSVELAVCVYAACNLLYHHVYTLAVFSVSGVESGRTWRVLRDAWLFFIALTVLASAVRWGLPGSLPAALAVSFMTLTVSAGLLYRLYRRTGAAPAGAPAD